MNGIFQVSCDPFIQLVLHEAYALQIFFFARIHDHFGSKKTFIAGIAASIPIIMLFPLMSLYAKAEGYSAMVWVFVGLQIVLSLLISLSYGEFFLPSISQPLVN